MEEEVEMNTVKPVVMDEAKIKEEQAMAKWRVSLSRLTSQDGAEQRRNGL